MSSSTNRRGNAEARVHDLRRGYPQVAVSLHLLGAPRTMPLFETAVRVYRESLDMEVTETARRELRKSIISVAQTLKDARSTDRTPGDSRTYYQRRLARLDQLFAEVAEMLGITEDELHTECGWQPASQM